MFAFIAPSVFRHFASLSPSSGSAAVRYFCSFSSRSWLHAVLKSTGSFRTRPNIASNGVFTIYVWHCCSYTQFLEASHPRTHDSFGQTWILCQTVSDCTSHPTNLPEKIRIFSGKLVPGGEQIIGGSKLNITASLTVRL